MTIPADKLDQASAVEPGAIDLERVKQGQSVLKVCGHPLSEHPDIDALIAAVEALRESVAALEDKLVVERAMVTMHKAAEDRAVYFSEAAEARVVELAGTLDGLIDVVDAFNKYLQIGRRTAFDDKYARALERARAALAAMPAKALERARAVERMVKAARFFMEDGVAEDSPDLNKVAWQTLDEALTALDALGEEEE